MCARFALGVLGAFALILLGSWSANADSPVGEGDQARPGLVGKVVGGTVDKARSVVRTKAAPQKAAPQKAAPEQAPRRSTPVSTSVRQVRKHVTKPVTVRAQKSVSTVAKTVDSAAASADRVTRRTPVVRRVVPDRTVSATVNPLTKRVATTLPSTDEAVRENVESVEDVVDGRADTGQLRPETPPTTSAPDSPTPPTPPTPPAPSTPEDAERAAGSVHDAPSADVIADVGSPYVRAVDGDASRTADPSAALDGHRTSGDTWIPSAPSAPGGSSAGGGSGVAGIGFAAVAIFGRAFQLGDRSARVVRRDDWNLPSSTTSEPGSSPD